MLRIPYLVDVSELESTSTFPILALPSYSPANSSTTGPTMRQGPHHSAQKSPNTGLSESAFMTSSSKESSVNVSALLISTFYSLVNVKKLLDVNLILNKKIRQSYRFLLSDILQIFIGHCAYSALRLLLPDLK